MFSSNETTNCGYRFRPPYQGNKEALGWALDGVARVVGMLIRISKIAF